MHDDLPMNMGGDGPQAVFSMFDKSICKMHYDLGTDEAPWSVARFSGVSLPGIDVYDDKGIGGRKVLRNLEDIAANPVDDFLLAIPKSACISLAQNGRIEACQPGHAILFSTARPFSSAISALRRGGQYAQLLCRISGAMLRQRVPEIDELSNFTFETADGAGKIARSLIEMTIAEGDRLADAQRHYLSSMLLDAIASATHDSPVVRNAATMGTVPALSKLRREASEYIDRHISDPGLSVARVAEHCGVSARYLHAAFAEVSIRVGSLIRETRLQGCRHSMSSKSMSGKSIADIARNWGYQDPAHFSRAYKARFGTSPSADRKPG